MRYTLMQLSDLHAGPPFLPEVAEAVSRQAQEIAPDLLVVSGDFVQRAILPGQWHTARAFLNTLPEPRLVVPGNHDVPLFDGFSRIFAPLRYYQRHISSEINPVFTLPGLAVVGGSSAHGLTTDGGYVSRKQREALQQTLAQFGPDTFKVVVFHHPIVDPPGIQHRSKISNARKTLEMLEQCDVQMYMCGHVHFSYIDAVTGRAAVTVASTDNHQGIIVCQSGTTTSRRGRGADRRKNSFNVVEIDERTVRVHPHFYQPEQGHFAPVAERVFPRPNA